MDIENNCQGNQDLNNNLNLLADVAYKEWLLISKHDELKQFISLKIEGLREYAIYYQKNIKNLEIKEINDLIENELSKFKGKRNLHSTSSNKPSLPQM